MRQTGTPESKPFNDTEESHGRHRRHARNAFALTFAGALAKVLVFLATVLIVKRLSLQENGVFQLAGTFGFLFAVVSEAGVRGLLLRELSRLRSDPNAAQEIFANTLNARVALSILLLPVMAAILYAAGYSSQIVFFSLWFTLYALLDSFAMLLKFAMRAYERMEIDAAASVAGRAVLLGGVALLAWSGRLNLPSVMAVHIFSAVLECAVLARTLKAVGPLRLRNPLRFHEMRSILVRSAPFAAATIAGLLYIQTGSIVLSLLRGEEAVALLKTAGKLPEAALFLPTAVVNAFIPFLSRRTGDTALMQRYMGFLLRYLGFAGIACAVLFASEPTWIMTTLFRPEYVSAAPAFRLMGIWMPLVFAQFVLVNILICLNMEHLLLRRYGAMVLLNLLLNLLLIPAFGVLGAAAALLLSEMVGVGTDVTLLRRRSVIVPLSTLVHLAGFTLTVGGAAFSTQSLSPVARLAVITVVAAMHVTVLAAVSDRAIVRHLLTKSAS